MKDIDTQARELLIYSVCALREWAETADDIGAHQEARIIRHAIALKRAGAEFDGAEMLRKMFSKEAL